MVIFRLAIKNLLGAGMRTWLNVVVTSVSFTVIIFFNAMYDGMRQDTLRILLDTEVAGGQLWHPSYDPFDPLSIEESHALIPGELQKSVEMKEALLKGRLKQFGDLLDSSWQLKKSINNRSSNVTVDKLYSIARKSGAPSSAESTRYAKLSPHETFRAPNGSAVPAGARSLLVRGTRRFRPVDAAHGDGNIRRRCRDRVRRARRGTRGAGLHPWLDLRPHPLAPSGRCIRRWPHGRHT